MFISVRLRLNFVKGDDAVGDARLIRYSASFPNCAKVLGPAVLGSRIFSTTSGNVTDAVAKYLELHSKGTYRRQPVIDSVWTPGAGPAPAP
jgi:hypothetical protein